MLLLLLLLLLVHGAVIGVEEMGYWRWL